MSRVPAEQRREQLIEATIDLAIEEGLAAASVRRIAERANVSLGVVHYCFSSKEALLNAVAESFATPILGPVAAAIEEGRAQGRNLEELGRIGFSTFKKVTFESPGRQLLSYELAAWSVRGDGEAARVLYRTYLEVIESFLTQGLGIQGSESMPTRVLARMVLSLTDGIMLAWMVDKDDDATDAVIEGFLAALFAVIGQAMDSGLMTMNPPVGTAQIAGGSERL